MSIPKKKVVSLHRLSDGDKALLGSCAASMAESQGFSKSFLASKRFCIESNGQASLFFPHNQNYTS